MSARLTQSALCLATLVLAATAHAQQPATPAPATPPATGAPAASAPTQDAAPKGPTRHTSTTKVGEATLTVEHGQPEWSDDRLGQMAQIAQAGQPWRMGAGTGPAEISTITVKGAPIFFGDQLIQPGRYGFNLIATGENAWSFIVYEPLHADQAPTMIGDEPAHQVAARFVGDAPEIVPLMTIDLAGGGETATCTLAWGPLRLSAGCAAVAVTHADLQLNGNDAKSTWYQRSLAADSDLTKPMIVGTIDLEIEGDDCSMNVYLMQQGSEIVALLRNREREEAEQSNAATELALKQFEAIVQQFGAQAEAQVGPLRTRAQRQLVKNEIVLEDSVNRPDNLRLTGTSEDAKGNKLACEIFQTRGSLNFEVCVGTKKALLRVDESAFALKASSS